MSHREAQERENTRKTNQKKKKREYALLLSERPIIVCK